MFYLGSVMVIRCIIRRKMMRERGMEMGEEGEHRWTGLDLRETWATYSPFWKVTFLDVDLHEMEDLGCLYDGIWIR